MQHAFVIQLSLKWRVLKAKWSHKLWFMSKFALFLLVNWKTFLLALTKKVYSTGANRLNIKCSHQWKWTLFMLYLVSIHRVVYHSCLWFLRKTYNRHLWEQILQQCKKSYDWADTSEENVFCVFSKTDGQEDGQPLNINYSLQSLTLSICKSIHHNVSETKFKCVRQFLVYCISHSFHSFCIVWSFLHLIFSQQP